MLVLTIKTDQPTSEFALYDDLKQLDKISYLADRNLANTLHLQVLELLGKQGFSWSDIDGLAGFLGPGSFTGLRIGLSVANSLAYSLSRPIIGEKGADWQAKAISKLLSGQNDEQLSPFYGAEPHITTPKK